MKIIVDAFGGDHAPVEILKGCALAVQTLDVDILVTGPEERIRKAAEENNISMERIEIADCATVMTMHDEPKKILKEFSDCSMAKGLQLVAQEQGDAFVTAGSTGAFVVGATFLTKRMKGIKRPALATVVPGNEGLYFLADIGANAECRPEMLVQFALMGHAYMKNVMGVEDPKVAMVNIGTEETKGGAMQQQAYQLLKKAPLHFCGNVEPRDIPSGQYDVVVCDGFTGNVILKLTEGIASAFNANIKEIMMATPLTKLAALTVKKGFKEFKKKMDYSEHGGAPLMGIAKPVFKAHGSSNAKAIMNTIRQAKLYVETNVNQQLAEQLNEMAAKESV